MKQPTSKEAFFDKAEQILIVILESMLTILFNIFMMICSSWISMVLFIAFVVYILTK